MLIRVDEKEINFNDFRYIIIYNEFYEEQLFNLSKCEFIVD